MTTTSTSAGTLAAPRDLAPVEDLRKPRGTVLWLGPILAVALAAAGSWLLAPFETQIVQWTDATFSHGTPQRRVIKWAAKLFGWLSLAAIAIWLSGQPRRWRLLRAFGATIGTAVVVLHALKLVIGRARPDQGLDLWHLQPFGNLSQGFDSFPSGHTTMAVLIAGLMAWYAPPTRWVLVPLAVLAAVSRMAQQRHYPSDLLAGALLALLVLLLARHVLGPQAFPRLQRPRWDRR